MTRLAPETEFKTKNHKKNDIKYSHSLCHSGLK